MILQMRTEVRLFIKTKTMNTIRQPAFDKENRNKNNTIVLTDKENRLICKENNTTNYLTKNW